MEWRTLMKNFIIQSLILLFSISLAACSSNTRTQNTGIGAVAGGVVGGVAGSAIGAGTGQVVAIGAGAIAGAIIGGAIGHSMESSDTMRTYSTFDHNPTNKKTFWKNRHTGYKYKIVPVSGQMRMYGYPMCRKYRATAIINGVKRTRYGIACRRQNGVWYDIR